MAEKLMSGVPWHITCPSLRKQLSLAQAAPSTLTEPTLVLPCFFVPSQCAPCWALGADDGHPRRQLCGGNQAATERIILFGRELQALSEQLGREYGKNLAHTEMLQVWSKPGLRTEWAPVW